MFIRVMTSNREKKNARNPSDSRPKPVNRARTMQFENESFVADRRAGFEFL